MFIFGADCDYSDLKPHTRKELPQNWIPNWPFCCCMADNRRCMSLFSHGYHIIVESLSEKSVDYPSYHLFKCAIVFTVNLTLICCYPIHRATSNKKLRETVSLELSFVNSNLQLLKEQLAVLNSSVEVYQGDQHGGLTHHIPMIPLGLKETKEVPFHDPLHVRLNRFYYLLINN